MPWSRKIWTVCGVATLATGLIGAGAVLSQESRRIPEQERELVKKVHEARETYQASLERLRAYYIHQKFEENRAWAENELTEFHLIVKNPYILDMDLPSPDLKPDKSIPKANRILSEALDWMRRPTITGREGNYKRAELLLRRLLRDYPQSDKVDETCYYLGDIYASRYFQQYRRSVAYYERVLHYEPNTNLDARLKAAELYEEQIADRRRAIVLYQEVLQREIDPKQTYKARRRLDALVGASSGQ